MRFVPLTQGKAAIVSNSDWSRVRKRRWYATRRRNSWYAMSSIRLNGKKDKELMHRFILRLKKGDGVQTDHWNCNGLDNQRRNLRRASHAQNQANQRKQNGRSSRFKGVYWNKERQKWQAQIEVGDDRYNLGRYKGEKDAARAYNAAARRYFGRFAKLNSL